MPRDKNQRFNVETWIWELRKDENSPWEKDISDKRKPKQMEPLQFIGTWDKAVENKTTDLQLARKHNWSKLEVKSLQSDALAWAYSQGINLTFPELRTEAERKAEAKKANELKRLKVIARKWSSKRQNA